MKTKLVIFLLVLSALLFSLQFFDIKENLKSALNWIANSGVWGILGFVVLYILSCIFFLPGSILTLGAGAIFGVVKGTVIVSAAATAGATCAFLVGRTIARNWVEKKIEGNEKFKTIDDAVAKEGWKIVGLTRLSPIFPFNLLNYAYGVTKVSLRDYFFASWFGMLPGTVMYVYIGSIAGELTGAATGVGVAHSLGAAQWTVRFIGLLATIAVTIYITRIAKKALKKRI